MWTLGRMAVISVVFDTRFVMFMLMGADTPTALPATLAVGAIP